MLEISNANGFFKQHMNWTWFFNQLLFCFLKTRSHPTHKKKCQPIDPLEHCDHLYSMHTPNAPYYTTPTVFVASLHRRCPCPVFTLIWLLMVLSLVALSWNCVVMLFPRLVKQIMVVLKKKIKSDLWSLWIAKIIAENFRALVSHLWNLFFVSWI